MKTMTLSIILLSFTTGVASAGMIADIRAGEVPDGTVVSISGAVVTAVLETSLTVSEPAGGPARALWVLCDGPPAAVAGDVVDLHGTYLEHNGRATLSLWSPAEASLTVVGRAEVPVSEVDAAVLAADPEAWESVLVRVTEELTPQGSRENGDWLTVGRLTGAGLDLDDYFGALPPQPPLGECLADARGVYFCYQDAHVLKALDLEVVTCALADEARGFSALKTMFR